jgi:hypothetical protein
MRNGGCVLHNRHRIADLAEEYPNQPLVAA